MIKHLKIKWFSLPNLPLFTWLSQVAGGTQGIPPSIEITTQFLEKKRNQGYRNGILVIMIYPLYPCINISVVWHILRHLKYTMYRLQWHSSTQVARKQTGSESVKKNNNNSKTRIFQLSPPWQLDIVDPQNLRKTSGGPDIEENRVTGLQNSFKLTWRIQHKSRNESQKTPRFSLKRIHIFNHLHINTKCQHQEQEVIRRCPFLPGQCHN